VDKPEDADPPLNPDISPPIIHPKILPAARVEESAKGGRESCESGGGGRVSWGSTWGGLRATASPSATPPPPVVAAAMAREAYVSPRVTLGAEGAGETVGASPSAPQSTGMRGAPPFLQSPPEKGYKDERVDAKGRLP